LHGRAGSSDANVQPAAVNRRCQGRPGEQRLQDGAGGLRQQRIHVVVQNDRLTYNIPAFTQLCQIIRHYFIAILKLHGACADFLEI